ncbi:MAG: helix-turn-helix domain-containing protein [Miltoncostaeaceae bacterium]
MGAKRQMADVESEWPKSRTRRGEPRTLTASEAAAVIGVSVATIRGWADQGRLPSHRTVGGHRRFEVEELKRWLQERGAAVPVPRRLARRPPEIPACPRMARWLNSRTEEIMERVLAGYDKEVPPPIPAPSEPALRRGAVRYLRVVAAALDSGRASSIAGRAGLAGFRGGVQGGAGASVIAEHLRYAVATIAEAEAGLSTGQDFESHALAALYAVIDRTQVAVVNGYVGARRNTGPQAD